MEIIKHCGGLDFEDVSLDDLLQIIDGQFHGDWKRIAWAFSELLALYASLDEDHLQQDPVDPVAWACAAIILSDAVREDAAEWELNTSSLMYGFLIFRTHFEPAEIAYLFQRMFV